MAINTKLRLSNCKFEQLSGSSLTLSGNTVVAASGSMAYATHPASFTDKQLVDKCYVDTSAGSISATNGLSRQGNNIVLGGTLTGATTVCTAGNQICILGSANSYFSGLNAGNNNAWYLTAYPATGNYGTAMFMTATPTRACIEILANNPSGAPNNGCALYRAYNDAGVGAIQLITKNSGNTTTSFNMLNTSNTFTDGVNSKGIVYGGAYKANFTCLSLVDADFVTGCTSAIKNVTDVAVTGATNGICKYDAHNVRLGNALTQNTDFTGAFNTAFGTSPSTRICNFSVWGRSSIQFSSTGATQMAVADAADGVTNLQAIILCSGAAGMKVWDNRNSKGLEYNGDYESNFTCRSLVTAKYVTGITTGGITTAINGLTKTGQCVELGGTTPLSKATDILGASQNLCLGTAACKVGAFQVNAASAAINSDGAINLTGAVCATGIVRTSSNLCVGGTLNATGNTKLAGTLTLPTVAAGTTSNPIMVLDAGVVKCVAASSYNVTAVNGLCAIANKVCLGGLITGATNLQLHSTGSPTLVITDTRATKVGIVYGGDYRTGFNNCTLITKEYADACDATTLSSANSFTTTCVGNCTITANNGLNKVGTNVRLGGALTGNTSLTGAYNLGLSHTNINLTATGAICATGAVRTNTNVCVGGALNVTGNTKINGTVTLPTVAAGSGSDPILVLQSGVVKCVAASGYNVTANNGITALSNNKVVLGGALTGDTTINGGNHDNCLIIASPFKADDVHYFTFHDTPAQTGHTCGRLYYQDNTLNLDREFTGVTLQIGEETVIKIENTGDNLLNGQAVYIDGATGQFPTVALAKADAMSTAAPTVGLLTQDVLSNDEGYVTTEGIVRGVNTGAYAAGDNLYLSASVAGAWTNVSPTYPNEVVKIGTVTKVGTSDGEIFVSVYYHPNDVSQSVFNSYTGTTLTNINSRLLKTTFNGYTGTTTPIINGLVAMCAIAITGVTNGLCKVGAHSAKLGGALTEPTTISGAQVFTVGTANNICLVTTTVKDIGINAKSNGTVYLKSQDGVVDGSDMSLAVGISLDYNAGIPMLVTDNSTLSQRRGLQYAGDYTATFCDRSLVDKYYVDSIATGLNVHAAVVAATSGSSIVLSGTSGSIDGISVASIVALNNRILVKDQTNAALNGIYSASTGVWGRTDDYNFSPAGEVSNGDLVPVLSGTTNANSQWINVSSNPIVSGDTITFSIFAQQQGITPGDGISVSTIGSNRQVSVYLSPSNAGLCFDTSALELDYNVFTCGLDTSTAGEVRVNASLTPATGTEIPVIIGTTGALVVDRDDFSYTTANNGLHKEGNNVVLGGALTGNTIVCGVNNYDLSFTQLDSFALGFCNGAVITDSAGSPHGICYASGTYRAGFVDLSLVDKRFVTDAITGATYLTASNGLTKTGGIICWGSTTGMVADAAICRSTSRLCMKSTGVDVIADCSCASFTQSLLTLRSCTNGTCNGSITLANTGAISLTTNNATLPICVTAPQALRYAGNYCTIFNAQPRAIPDVAWVTGKTTTAGLQTANNGLTKIGTNVVLGGALTGNTLITNADSYSFTIEDSNNVGLTIDSTGGVILGDTTRAAGTTPFLSFQGETMLVGGSNVMEILTDCSLAGAVSTGIHISAGDTCCVVIDAVNAGLFKIAAAGSFFEDGSGNGIGLQYCANYCGGYTQRSLVDCEYVNKLVSGSTGAISANNGLSRQGNNIVLGGTLTGATTVAGCTTCSLEFSHVNANDSALIKFNGEGTIDIKVYSGQTCSASETGLQIGCQSVIVSANSASGGQSIEFNANAGTMTVADGRDSKGLVYGGDYESNFSPRSLVTCQYVTSQTSGITGTVTSVTATTTTTGTDISVSVANSTTTPAITLCIPTASAANRGALSAADWTTFNAKTTCVGTVTSVAALTISTAGTDITSTVANGTTTPVITLCIPTASAANRGALSAADWSTFNAKTTCTGTVTGANNGLHATSTTVSLGGALTGNTTIGGGAYTLNVSGITAFNACATNIGLTGAVCVTGVLNTTTTATIGGNLTLSTVGAGSASDDVLTVTAGGVVQKISSSALGEDNNRWTVEVVTTNITLPTTGYTILVSGATSLTLPAAPANGAAYKIKDAAGTALSSPITVNGNGNNIDGNSTALINTDYGSLALVYSSAIDEWFSVAFIN